MKAEIGRANSGEGAGSVVTSKPSLTLEDTQVVDSPADTLRSSPLRIGISTRALFDLEEEHRVFEEEGVKAYAAMQLDREDEILRKGTGFEVVERLLALNEPESAPYVEVILLSQNSPDLSLRAFKSIDHYGLSVKTGSFTSGRSLSDFVPA
jgi:5'-nucleotidase